MIRFSSFLFTVLIASQFLGEFALAEDPPIKVWIHTVGGNNDTIDYYESGDDISYTNLTTSVTRINIWDHDGGTFADIGRITLGSSSGINPIPVILGSGDWLGTDYEQAKACTNWAGITITVDDEENTVRDKIRIEGRIGGNLTNSVHVGQIAKLTIDGNIQSGASIHSYAASGWKMIVECASLNANADIIADVQNAKRIKTTSGDLAGQVTVSAGYIGVGGTLAADRGIIVAGDVLKDITAGKEIHQITASGTIGTSGSSRVIITTGGTADCSLIKASSIYADISLVGAGAGLKQFVTTGSPPSGDFSGSLNVGGNLQADLTADEYGISIAGDLDADVTIALAIKEPIKVTGNLTSGHTIRTDVSMIRGEDAGENWKGYIKIDGNMEGDIHIARTISGGDIFIGDSTSDVMNGNIWIGERIVDFRGFSSHASQITVAGTMNGDITVGRDLETDCWIEVAPSDGLVGQIILNRENLSHAWDGDIKVGGTALSPRGDYTNKLSGDMGGGAVGLATFNYYGADCDPAEGETIDYIPTSVTLRHYGPVRHDGTGMPVKIERRSITYPATIGVWEDVTSKYSVSISGKDVTIDSGPIWYWYSPFEYRITPVTTGDDTLKCDQVDGNPAVDAYTWMFSIDV